jgi:hypothetical protein
MSLQMSSVSTLKPSLNVQIWVVNLLRSERKKAGNNSKGLL